MAAVAHNPTFAGKVGIPMSVGEKFNAADERAGNFGQGKHKPPPAKHRRKGKRGQ